MLKNKKNLISVIGMGYVGLPLANQLSKKFDTIGYDINKKKIFHLKNGNDETNELNKINKKLKLTSKLNDLKKRNVFILCLPTPVNKNKKPELKILENCLKQIAKIFKPNDTIVIESTYYPGATENLINKFLGKKFKMINIGYSPERINPGDKKNTISKITKVVSANNKSTLNLMKKIYGSINKNNIYAAKSIRVAEAAKLIENIQRDINIGLVNELTKIFNRLDLSIHDILKTSNTKWNFLKFKPGLVGGHCIGVDPYYLKFICDKIKFEPKVFMSARNINESMIEYYNKIIQKFLKKGNKILYLGLSFKENTNDLRNSKNLELLKKLSKNYRIDFYDPLIKNINLKGYNISKIKKVLYDVVILAVPHNTILKFLNNNLKTILRKNGKFIDLNNNYKKINKNTYKYITL